MTDPAAQAFEIVPTGAALGADIVGLDLARGIDAATFRKIHAAWNDHLVLRFRGQHLDDDALAAFSARFGELDEAPARPPGVPHHPSRSDVIVMSNIVVDGKPIGSLGNAELVWHQDMSYNPQPPKASLLYGIETPATGGGTSFYNLYKSYGTLPEELREKLRGLSCKHDATRNSAGELRAGLQESYSNEERPGAVHPMVVRHPETGRETLYLGRRPNAWIVGLSDAASDALLDEVWAHVDNGAHHWTQNWQPGDLVIWDNRCTLHRRGPLDPNQRRLMHRTQVRDEQPPVAAHAG